MTTSSEAEAREAREVIKAAVERRIVDGWKENGDDRDGARS